MDFKQIQSKINLLNAQLRQLRDSGIFSEAEVERLSFPINLELKSLNFQLEQLLPADGANEIIVASPEIVS